VIPWRRGAHYGTRQRGHVRVLTISALSEYELIYTQGGGPASIADPAAYTAEASTLADGEEAVAATRGPGMRHWVLAPYYHDRCEAIISLSVPQHAVSMHAKVAHLGSHRKAVLVTQIFDTRSPRSIRKSALIGSSLATSTLDEERHYFTRSLYVWCGRPLHHPRTAWNSDGRRRERRRLADPNSREAESPITEGYFDATDFVQWAQRTMPSIRVFTRVRFSCRVGIIRR